MADVNERRKAQNRTAQKKYRELVDAWPETEPLVPQLKPGPKKQRNHEHDRNCASNSPELSCAINHTSRPTRRRTGATGSPRDALAAALEQYGMPFDLDGGSTHNMNSADSTTAMGD
ncbi:hypothetical protein PtrSN002B_009591 [Pyrenophora tritici-repentis]|nr:hypothetical protein Alg215_08123 [Pyrenophora tritici-repentis]KAI1527406.1 hypothetical protein PtrSN001A_009459 [Pyrenophora tritici-repentis]KAI1536603.1 hypothetical protein PtrSN002B_009591 [Pyrenophora tritici-repentis]KAI1563077.1 hypothetical protein PtrEW4_009602 [Pyrenophora tritici-repentis]KAI1566186.1 hypothetical protein PtrEW7m1_009631 [Pyrenophora tritici-repentis]